MKIQILSWDCPGVSCDRVSWIIFEFKNFVNGPKKAELVRFTTIHYTRLGTAMEENIEKLISAMTLAEKAVIICRG